MGGGRSEVGGGRSEVGDFGLSVGHGVGTDGDDGAMAAASFGISF